MEPVYDQHEAGGSCPYCGQPVTAPPDPLDEFEKN